MDIRKFYIQAFVILIAIIFALKLLYIQVFDTRYKLMADSNSIQRIEIPARRGVVFDRNGKQLVVNKTIFELAIIPKELKIKDSTAFCDFFDVDRPFLRTQIAKAKKYAWHKPSIFIKQISFEKLQKIQDRLTEFQGVYVKEKTIRGYPHKSLANTLGYVKEVDKRFLSRDTTGYYKKRDWIGKSGIEAFYESFLKGKRGVKYDIKNVRGVSKGSFQGGKYDTLSISGQDLVSSIDLDLQKYAELLMQNKRGAVVAIEPSTGEVLVMLSAPSYDPNILTGEGEEVSQHYKDLVINPDKPLFNRAIMANYPPGSTFKTLVSLTGLQDGVLDTVRTRYYCNKDLVGCHNHKTPLNLFGAIQYSCNPYYFQAFRKVINQGKDSDNRKDTRIGLDHWRKYALEFGLGRKLGIDLPYEKRGLIPSSNFYDRVSPNGDWKLSSIQSISIGQGEIGILPVQLANMSAVIANRGWYITPHLIKSIGTDSLAKPFPQFTKKHYTSIDAKHFDFVARAMSGIKTAALAKIPNMVTCGKTGTAQNPHGEDHSVFMAFAPMENPKIAIAVYVENAGFGGSWAGPIASLLMEKYINGEIMKQRKWIEKRVLDKNFMNVEN